MKKLLLLFALLFGVSLFASAQGDISYPGSNPLGVSCTTTYALYQGKLYYCSAGVYVLPPTSATNTTGFVTYPLSSPSGNACTLNGTQDPMAQVFGGSVYTCQAGTYQPVAGGGGGGGNLNNSGTPTAGQGGIFVDATHLKGVTYSGDATINGTTGVIAVTKLNGITPGGTCTNQVATAISASGVPTCTTLSSAYVGNSIAVTGVDINTSSQVTATHLSAPLPSAQGGSGIASPTANSLLIAEGASANNLLTSPTTNGNCIVGFNVSASAKVDPTCALSGVPVNAQSGNYSVAYTDRASYIKYSGGTTATLTLPQVTGTTASNLPFVVQNLNSGNLTVTANAADKIDNSATGGSITILPNFAAYIYQDSSSAPGNWWSIQTANFSAYGVTGALCGWSTSTGWSCGNLTGDITTTGSKVTTLANLNINATVADYIAGGGTAQAQTATFSPALTALTTGAHGRFLPVAANTAAAPTLAVNGLTAKNITKCGTVALVANDLLTTVQAYVDYDGTEWVLLNPQAIGCSAPKIQASTGFFLPTLNSATSVGAVVANTTKLWAVDVNSTVTTTKVEYQIITTADNTANLYDVGYYDASGTLVCHIGATAGTTFSPSTGVKTLSWTGGGCTLTPGRYYEAMTDNSATALLGGGGNTPSPVCNVNPATNNTTSGGALNSSITFNADAWTTCTVAHLGAIN